MCENGLISECLFGKFSGSIGRGTGCVRMLTLIAHFAVRERHVSVLDHVPDLTLHGDEEQRDEVHHQYGPKDRYVQHAEECAYYRYH